MVKPPPHGDNYEYTQLLNIGNAIYTWLLIKYKYFLMIWYTQLTNKRLDIRIFEKNLKSKQKEDI